MAHTGVSPSQGGDNAYLRFSVVVATVGGHRVRKTTDLSARENTLMQSAEPEYLTTLYEYPLPPCSKIPDLK